MHNEQQLQAINSTAPTIMVVAGPGSGKTATTVARIRRLIDTGTDPRGIVALTFTNNAARELEERITKSCPECGGAGYTVVGQDPPEQQGCQTCWGGPNLGYCGTLHGFALRMLKQHGTALGYGDRMAIIDPEATADLLQSKADSLGCKMKLADLQKLKTQPRRPGSQTTLPEVVIASYREDLREAGLVDFDCMLEEFHRLCTTPMAWPAYTHLFVDESQDSSSLDWQIYNALPIPNKFYVGDPDQAIYSFRGGSVKEFIMRALRPGDGEAREIIYLETNYRSHAEICQAANNLIAHNTTRLEKHTISAKGKGGYVDIAGRIPNMSKAENEGEEMGQVVRQIKVTIDAAASDGFQQTIAVLTRTNAIAYEYTQALKAAGIAVREPPRPNLPKDWIAARALISLLVQPDNDSLAYFYEIASEQRRGSAPGLARQMAHKLRKEANAAGLSMNQHRYHFIPERFPGSSDVGRILAEHGYSLETRMLVAGKIKELGPDATLLDLSLALAQTRTNESENAPRESLVNVTTIHGAKGLEFDIVYLVGCEQETMPGIRKNSPPEAIEEERRLCYVAITRARRSLFIRHAQSRKTPWGAIQSTHASQFIDEILK